ncbi:AraC family transcriptional regulator [Sedimenticola sp.]|uniref:AraC family transcriptional regulator n=1 Tax=Sedimenticola sp. TaxID=1940285 RepID=UPI003D09CD77
MCYFFAMSLRRTTAYEHQTRINEVLYLIHADLSASLDIGRLAQNACYSPYHFQRIFRQITGESVHDYIRRCRLEWAANLLIYNPNMAIVEVAGECGFQSNAAFNHAFKAYFGCSPTYWRREGYANRSRTLKAAWSESERNPLQRYYRDTLDSVQPSVSRKVEIRRLTSVPVAYIRHVGYDPRISEVWAQLLDWGVAQGIDVDAQAMIGLHHSNPDLVAFDQCRYVACLALPEPIYPSDGVGVMEIPGGLYACCRGEGMFGDLLYLMRDLYRHWLPASDYQARSLPPYALYHDNHFINQSGHFSLEFRIPVTRKIV